LGFPSSVTIPAGQRSQTFDVNVVDNEYRDGDRLVQLTSTAENNSASGVPIEIFDDEVSAILLLPTEGGTVLTEELGTDDFGVTLASRPQGDVLINLNLIDGDAGPLDMTLDTNEVLFTTDNWNVPHMVSLTGIPDLLAEGDEVGNVTLRVDAANSDSIYSAAPEALLDVVILDWQPSTLRISEDASSVFLEDNTSGIRLVAGTHASGLNVLGNELPQVIVIERLTETTGLVQVDLGAGADEVELNGARFTHLEGGAGVDRFVVNTETTFELLEYINGRVFGFEEYVLQPQEGAVIEVDLNRLGQFAASGEAVVLDLYVKEAEQFAVLGEGLSGSPEMVGGQFAQVIVSEGGMLRVLSERPWQNVIQPVDPNHDGEVTALDALVILNHLGVYGSFLPEAPTLADFRGLFLDVSGDGHATPLDSLLVLNQIASTDNSEGEGSEFPMIGDIAKSRGTAKSLGTGDWQSIQADGLLSTREPSLMKSVSISHPADQAIRDLYSLPDTKGEETNGEETERVGDLLESKNSM
ncbi:MAG: dockerin type I domain-containing protein, partial [Rubripirellula sp.]